MTWNNRIVKNKQGLYSIHEVYYNVDGVPYSMTKNPIHLGHYESPEELKQALQIIIDDANNREVFVEPENW